MSECEQGRSRVCVASWSLRPAGLAAALLCAPWISSIAASMDEVVVSATRTEQRLSDVLADVTVVDRETIGRSGWSSVAELLARQPGIQVTSNGGPATTTNVLLRGASTQYTAVYLDGVRMDSQVTSGGTTWPNIPLALIDRIEILRGAAAAVYGSDAVAGVILLTTKKGQGALTPYIGAGYGSQGSFRAHTGLSGSRQQWDYSLAAVREGSRGFDAQPDVALSDNEGYQRTALQANVGLRLNPQHSLRMQAFQTKTHSDYVASKVGADHQYHREMQTVGAVWQAQWTPLYQSTLSASSSRDKYTLQPSGKVTDAQIHNYLWQHEVSLPHHQKLTAALERREDSLRNPSVQKSAEQKRHQNALALGWGITVAKHALQLNVRRDVDSEFGGKNTAAAAYAWNFAPQWTARASLGTSFRVPTLYQRFSDSGDASLRAEEGRNKELSLRWAQGDNHASLTLYRNRLQNMISSVKEGGIFKYRNVDLAVLEGVTLAGAYHTGVLKWHGSVDFQNPINATNGHLLERRSKRFMTLGVDATLAEVDWGAEIYAASRRYDKKTDAVMSLGGYTLLSLVATKHLAHDLTFIARVDNVLDRDYALAKGYATAGRTVYLGLEWAAY